MADHSNHRGEHRGQYQDEEVIHDVIPVSGMYENWFLDYASYVILERAVPAIEDGFKPVQRRIMHAMKELDDGRYNKVANIIGSTIWSFALGWRSRSSAPTRSRHHGWRSQQ